MNQRKYILKGGKSNPSWELKNHHVLVKKSDKEGLREIQYVPGANSIWKEENKDQGPAKSIWFTDGSLMVNEDDKIMIQFLEKHPDFNKKFELFDPEAKAREELKKFELVEKAKELLRDQASDSDKLIATAASIFDHRALDWKENVAKLKLFQKADTDPQKLIDALNDPTKEAKYIAAMAFKKNIVRTNEQKTAVVWDDNEAGLIVVVPTGKKPIVVLGDYLADNENETDLQAIGEQLDILDKGGSKKKKQPKKAATA